MVMRTTLTIDDEVYAIARQVAALKHLSVGAALSELARRGLERTARPRADADFPSFEVSENAPTFGLGEVAEDEG